MHVTCNCSRCVYGQIEDNLKPTLIKCRRFPQTVNKGMRDWCGEFKLKR